MRLFHKQRVQFRPVDPLGDGLGDDIAAERREAEAINSLEDANPKELEHFWTGVIRDVEKDPDWFNFTDS